MNIVVLVKQTIDLDETITLHSGQIQREDLKVMVNPYDEYAIEESVRLKESHGGKVTVVTYGIESAVSAIRQALAMGADEGIHILDENGNDDEFFIAKAIAKVIKQVDYDLILAGNMSVDNAANQVAIRVADNLGLLHVSSAVKIKVQDHTVNIERDVEGANEIVETTLPLLITAQQGLNEPRYASLSGIMKAKKKIILTHDLEDLDLDCNVQTLVHYYSHPPQKDKCKFFKGSIQLQVKNLVMALQK